MLIPPWTAPGFVLDATLAPRVQSLRARHPRSGPPPIPFMSTDSGVQTKNRFNTEASAEKYAGSLGGTPTHFREVRCIREALGGLPKGAKVLDMPSGTEIGRAHV